MNKTAENCLNDVIKISNRIVKATFAGNPEKTTILAYSPTNDKKNEAEVSTFYNNLRPAIDVILGNFNAKMSASHVKHAHDKGKNENSKRLLDLKT